MWAVVAAAALLAGAPGGDSVAFASPQRVIDAGLVVLVRTAGGEVGNGIVVGANEVVTSCSVLEGAVSIGVHETWKQPVARPAEGVPAILAARDEEERACLLFLQEPFWRSPPVDFTTDPLEGTRTADGYRHRLIFTVSVADGNMLTVRRGLVGAPSNPVDGKAAAALASRPDPSPAADRHATPLSEAGAGVFDERGRLVAMIALERPRNDRHRNDESQGEAPLRPVSVPARDIAPLLELSAEWRACLASPTPDCILAEAERTAIASGWGVDLVATAWKELGDRERAEILLKDDATISPGSGPHGPHDWLAFALVQFEEGDEAGALESLAALKSEATRKWDDAYWRIDFYARAAASLVEVGAAGAAEDLADEALLLVNDRDGRDRTLGGAVRVQASAGQTGAAVSTARLMADGEKRRHALGEASRALVKSGDLEAASWVAGAISDTGYRTYVLQTVAAALARRGEVARAIHLAGASRSSGARNHSLDAVTREFIGEGEFEAALETALQMDDTWQRVETLRWLARNQAEAGDFQGALSTAENLKPSRASGSEDSPGYNSCQRKAYCGALSYLAEIMAEAGEVERAFAAHERLEEPLDRLLVLAKVAPAVDALGDAEVREAVLELADEVPVDTLSDIRDLEDIAPAQAAVGDHEGAERTLASVARATWSVDYLNASGSERRGHPMSDSKLNAKKTDSAVSGIVRVLRAADDYRGALAAVERLGSVHTRLWHLRAIAEAQAAAGDAEDARLSYAAALNEAERMRGVGLMQTHTDDRNDSLGRIAYSQVGAGFLQEALETVSQIDPGRRNHNLSRVVHAACSAGQFRYALRVQGLLDDWRDRALVDIARGLAGLPARELFLGYGW